MLVARRRSRRTRAPAPGARCAATNHSCAEPTWFVVRSPSTLMPSHGPRATSEAKRLVASEQRVDAVERGGVVAMRAPRREHRRQVEHVRAERQRRGRGAPRSRGGRRRTTRTGVSGPRPVGSSSQPRGIAHSGGVTLTAGRCEPVREDLVDDRLEVPVGPARAQRTGRSRPRPGRRTDCTPDAVQPRVADVAAGQQPAIRRGRVPDRERRAPPDVGVRLTSISRASDLGLAVAHVAQRDLVRRRSRRDAEEHGDVVAELGRRLRERKPPSRRGAAGREVRARRPHPLTAPA